MEVDMEVGLTKKMQEMVSHENTAKAVGSGGLDVYATPAMIALIEKTCYTCIQEQLDSGLSSVGTLVKVAHVSATPIGNQVECVAKIEKVEGRKVEFIVEVCDDFGIIGEGRHERIIIDIDRFMTKVNGKLDE